MPAESRMSPDPSPAGYRPLRISRSEFLSVRGLRYHVRVWEASRPGPTVFLLHGWMDVSASFQFLVDHLPADWRLIAPDWRGFGATDWPAERFHQAAAPAGSPAVAVPRRVPGIGYWQPDYLADLEAVLDHYSPDRPVRLVGHSMGGNVVTLYAGVRAQRVERLVNLEGVGMPSQPADRAPARFAQWLDEVRAGVGMLDYPSLAAVAERLMRNNPRLRPEFAHFLAPHWSRRRDDGRYELLGDPAHKLINPVLYRVEEALACWREITAPVLFVLSEHLNDWHRFVDSDEYRLRLNAFRTLTRATVAQAGHMMHHDQPESVARLIEGFMS